MVQCSSERSRTEIQHGRSSLSSKSSRSDTVVVTGPDEISPTTGQPSAQVTGARNVSRPSTCQPGVPPPGRTPSSTIHHCPSGACTRSACPVFCTGSSVLRCDRIGLAGHGSNGPSGAGPRAIETPWPRSVPPSAIIRYQYSPIRYRCGASGALAPGVPDQSRFDSPSVSPVARSIRYCPTPATVHQQLPSSSHARSGSMPPTPGSRIGSDHGPAGSVAVNTMFPPPWLTLVTISQNRPS